jgi:hypothetical protein
MHLATRGRDCRTRRECGAQDATTDAWSLKLTAAERTNANIAARGCNLPCSLVARSRAEDTRKGLTSMLPHARG